MADKEKFTTRRIEGPLADRARQQFEEGWYSDFIEILPGHMIMPGRFTEYLQKIQDFEVKDSDVWVISYPKAGTTWTQEMVWCIMNDLDFEGAKQDLMLRFPFLEWDSLLPESMEGVEMSKDDPCMLGNQWKILHSMKCPRTIKSHLIKQLLPAQTWTRKPKLIYVCRDPRDVCVSYYYHSVKLDGYTGKFDEFVELFLADLLPWSPFWLNVLEFWKIRDQENVLFIRFEDMKKDLPSVLRQVCCFLGKELTQEQIEELADHLSFECMRKNPAVNNEKIPTIGHEASREIKFMRKGKVGDWKNHFSEAQRKQFQTWTRDSLKGTDFPYYQDYE